MAHRILHVGLVFPGPSRTQVFDAVFDMMGDDWIRYAANNWLISTQKTPLELFMMIKHHLQDPEQVLIVPISGTEASGWGSKWIWDWIQLKTLTPEKTFGSVFGSLLPSPLDGGKS